MTTYRPVSSTYSVFPQSPHSTSNNRRKSTRTTKQRMKARTQSTQIAMRRDIPTKFAKLIKPMDQVSVITCLYHEVLTEIYKEELAGSRPGTAGKLSTHEQFAIEDAYRQLSSAVDPFNKPIQRRSLDSQPLYPQRQDSLLPPPPLAHRRQMYHDRQRREKPVLEQPFRQWAVNPSTDTLSAAPLNFSRLDRKGWKERNSPLSSPSLAVTYGDNSQLHVGVIKAWSMLCSDWLVRIRRVARKWCLSFGYWTVRWLLEWYD